tara:strand:- start:570 stop:743 length:174 start_codon:yes stop_codon:yes gene_type:complete
LAFEEVFFKYIISRNTSNEDFRIPTKKGEIPAIGDGETTVKKVLYDMELTNHPIPVL